MIAHECFAGSSFRKWLSTFGYQMKPRPPKLHRQILTQLRMRLIAGSSGSSRLAQMRTCPKRRSQHALRLRAWALPWLWCSHSPGAGGEVEEVPVAVSQGWHPGASRGGGSHCGEVWCISAADAMCYGDRLHVNSCGHLGHPPSGGGMAPSVLSATRYSAGQKQKVACPRGDPRDMRAASPLNDTACAPNTINYNTLRANR